MSSEASVSLGQQIHTRNPPYLVFLMSVSLCLQMADVWLIFMHFLTEAHFKISIYLAAAPSKHKSNLWPVEALIDII